MQEIELGEDETGETEVDDEEEADVEDIEVQEIEVTEEKTIEIAMNSSANTGFYTLIACTYAPDGTYKEYASAVLGYVKPDDERNPESLSVRGCRQIFNCHDRIFHTVRIQFRICDLEKYNCIYLHSYVILCNNRLRIEINNVFFKIYFL